MTEHWKQYWLDANADATWTTFHSDEDKVRAAAVPAMLQLLDRFLSAEIPLEDFRSEFDRRTRTDWASFGLKGLSGAMFLNMLAKYIPDKEVVSSQLRVVLLAPNDEGQALERLQTFTKYLDGVIERKEARRRKLQPARAPFFVSAWWHMQQAELWPIYYQSGRSVLELDKAYEVTRDPVKDYFRFRRAFLDLSTRLSIGSWQCEHLLDWRHQQAKPPKPPTQAETNPTDLTADDVPEENNEPPLILHEETVEPSSHAHIQWLLARIGRKVGCQVWIASNDRSKKWEDQLLGDLSIDSLPPLGVDPYSQKLIALIDLVWLRGKNVVAAFEIEHTTSIYSGLLRLSDLVVECPNLNFPL